MDLLEQWLISESFFPADKDNLSLVCKILICVVISARIVWRCAYSVYSV